MNMSAQNIIFGIQKIFKVLHSIYKTAKHNLKIAEEHF